MLLAEAEDGLNRITESLHEVEGLQADADAVRAQGMAVPVTQSELETQRLGLISQTGPAKNSARDLNRRLAELLSLDDAEPYRIWPDVDLKVDASPLDAEAEVATAMATRADLSLLAYLRCSVDPQTLPAIREALGGVSGGLGLALVAAHVSGHRDTGESDVRRNQLDELLADRQRAVAREVRDAVAAIHGALQQVAVRNEQFKVQSRQLDNLSQQRAIGAATSVDVHRARLNLVSAQQQLFHEVVQWKIAVVRLREAQGVLATGDGCGLAVSSTDEPTPAPRE